MVFYENSRLPLILLLEASFSVLRTSLLYVLFGNPFSDRVFPTLSRPAFLQCGTSRGQVARLPRGLRKVSQIPFAIRVIGMLRKREAPQKSTSRIHYRANQAYGGTDVNNISFDIWQRVEIVVTFELLGRLYGYCQEVPKSKSSSGNSRVKGFENKKLNGAGSSFSLMSPVSYIFDMKKGSLLDWLGTMPELEPVLHCSDWFWKWEEEVSAPMLVSPLRMAKWDCDNAMKSSQSCFMTVIGWLSDTFGIRALASVSRRFRSSRWELVTVLQKRTNQAVKGK